MSDKVTVRVQASVTFEIEVDESILTGEDESCSISVSELSENAVGWDVESIKIGVVKIGSGKGSERFGEDDGSLWLTMEIDQKLVRSQSRVVGKAQCVEVTRDMGTIFTIYSATEKQRARIVEHFGEYHCSSGAITEAYTDSYDEDLEALATINEIVFGARTEDET